jgi:hypothetical protein
MEAEQRVFLTKLSNQVSEYDVQKKGVLADLKYEDLSPPASTKGRVVVLLYKFAKNQLLNRFSLYVKALLGYGCTITRSPPPCASPSPPAPPPTHKIVTRLPRIARPIAQQRGTYACLVVCVCVRVCVRACVRAGACPTGRTMLVSCLVSGSPPVLGFHLTPTHRAGNDVHFVPYSPSSRMPSLACSVLHTLYSFVGLSVISWIITVGSSAIRCE